MKLKPTLIIDPYTMKYLIAESPFDKYIKDEEYANEYLRISDKIMKLYDVEVAKITLRKDVPRNFLMFDNEF